MRSNFTKLLFGVFAMIATSHLIGQDVNNLQIISPPEIAGDYIIGLAGWGGSPEAQSGIATFGIDGVDILTDGCENSIENVEGKIAFVDRGQCQFGTKALNAEMAGAAAVIICNRADEAGNGPQGMAAGDVGDQVTIPTYSMSYDDCLIIREYAEGGEIEVEFNTICDPLTYPENTVWGDQPGEGDFDGGLNGWTVVSEGDTSWAWTGASIVPGLFTSFSFTSASACNGYMAFASDQLDTQGTSQGSGPCVAPCAGELISPEIDLTGVDAEALFLRFTQAWRYFNNAQTLLISSYDGGVTWPDSLDVTSAAETNIAGFETLDAPLLSYNGERSVIVKFNHFSNYYYYTLDDISLISAPEYHDVQIRRNFYSAAPAYEIPLSQAQDMAFHVDIENKGSTDATNVTIQADVIGPGGNVEATFTNDTYEDQPPFVFLNENSTFSDTYVPTQVGSHRVVMSNITAGDSITVNDTLSYGFNISEDTWRSCPEPAGSPTFFDGLIFDDPTNGNFIGLRHAIGYSFYLPNGDGHVLNTLKFGVVDRPTNSGDLFVYLYAWTPGPDAFGDDPESIALIDQLGNYIIDGADLRLLGVMGEDMDFNIRSNSVLLNPNLGSRREVNIRMAKADPTTGSPDLDANGDLKPLELLDDMRYLLAFAIVPTSTNDADFVSMVANSATNNTNQRQWATDATNLAMDNINIDRYVGCTAKGLTDGSFQEIDNLSWDGVIGGGNFSTLIEQNQLWLEMNISAEPLDTEDLSEDAASSVRIYPNPASELLTIDIELEEVSDIVTLELVDIQGRMIMADKYQNVKNDVLTINVKNIPNGVYFMNVRSDAGFTSKKVMINK